VHEFNEYSGAQAKLFDGIMKSSRKQFVITVLVSAAAAGAVYALLRFTAPHWYSQQSASVPTSLHQSTDSWEEAVAKVKEDRVESATQPGIEVPPQLRHYSDRNWFLATQVAEVHKYNIQTSQDFVDLAALIVRGELVSVPALTDNYILYGVGATANSDRFNRFADDHSVELYTEAELRDAYARIEGTRASIGNQTASLRGQLGALKKGDRAKQRELQKQISAREQELKAVDDEKALLDQSYGTTESRQRLFMDYQSLQQLAKNFAGRSYNLDNPGDRQSMKINLLRALRPQALKVLEELAEKYHANFGRRLPVSSLVRPEQYQHALRKVNRNAVLIDTPPHSTGLAFDIDYRYMSAGEQAFVMTELARLEDEGRIETLRERTANYHVFVFLNGTRPSDELIAASLEQAGAPDKEANHADTKPAKANNKSQKLKKTSTKARSRKRR
jgi:hypothetical protein